MESTDRHKLKLVLFVPICYKEVFNLVTDLVVSLFIPFAEIKFVNSYA
jgi:hypothetical protein